VTSRNTFEKVLADKKDFKGIVVSLISIAASICFPGTGFLFYFIFRDHLGKHKRSTIITLCILQVVHLLTFLGTAYGPLISHVGPAVRE
jgi:hypothetical protein